MNLMECAKNKFQVEGETDVNGRSKFEHRLRVGPLIEAFYPQRQMPKLRETSVLLHNKHATSSSSVKHAFAVTREHSYFFSITVIINHEVKEGHGASTMADLPLSKGTRDRSPTLIKPSEYDLMFNFKILLVSFSHNVSLFEDNHPRFKSSIFARGPR